MAVKPKQHVVVVDGSNLATEGRTLPSLRQLDEAVRAYAEEDPDAEIVVVVDASFEHRIDASERSQLVEAELHGEVVSPPAGAIGRGDAFVLRIAERTGARVLSNDSFQEFHAEHPWLFDEGRLVGGKPVPGIGWIFTPRLPVRGPKSRQVTGKARRAAEALSPPVKAAELAKAAKKAAARRVRPLPPGVTPKVGDVWTALAAGNGHQAGPPEGEAAVPAEVAVAEAAASGATGMEDAGAVKGKATKAAKAATATKATKGTAKKATKAATAKAATAKAAKAAGAKKAAKKAAPEAPEAPPAEALEPAEEVAARVTKKAAVEKAVPARSAKKAAAKKAAAKEALGSEAAIEAAAGEEPVPGKAAAKKAAAAPAAAKKAPAAKATPAKKAAAKEAAAAKATPAKKAAAKKAEPKKVAVKRAPAKKAAPAKAAPAKVAATEKAAGRVTRAEQAVVSGAPAPRGIATAGRTAREDPAVRVAIDEAMAEVLAPPKPAEDGKKGAGAKKAKEQAAQEAAKGKRRRRRAGGPPPAVNEPLAFITFVAAYPLQSEVEGEVVSYTSHGAMVDVDLPEGGLLHCYIPLTAMGDPPPAKARQVLARGERRRFVLVGLDPPRRVAELALPDVPAVVASAAGGGAP